MDESEVKTDKVVKKTPVPKADQDQMQANYAGEVERQIDALLKNPETLALVSARGYEVKKLGVGQGKVTAFQGKVNTRQQSTGMLQASSITLKAAFGNAKLKVTDLRESVRVVCPKDKAAQKALGVTERVPQDQEKFLLFARTGSDTAKKAPHAAALQGVGFDVAAYDAAIEAFAQARAAFTVGEQNAKQATAERDAAYQELKDWAQPFRRIARLALKTRPDLLTPLGL